MTSDRKHILIVSPYFAPEDSGSAPYVTGLAKSLARDYSVTVLTGVPHYPQWRVLAGYEQWRSDTVQQGYRLIRLRHYVPTRQSARTRAMYEASFAARTLLEGWKHRADLVISFSPPVLSTLAARILATHKAARTFGIIVHDLAGKGAHESGMSGGRKVADIVSYLEMWALRQADGVVVLHDHFKQLLVSECAILEPKVTIIRNWVHIAEPANRREAIRNRMGWDGRTVVLHSGNMGLKQGLENVVQAARLAGDRGLNIHFVLMGDGNQRSSLELEAAGVKDLTILPPANRDDFPDVLAAADFLLVNERAGSRDMSVPSKMTSYFATGRPVIAATTENSPTHTEMKLSGAGPVVPAGNPGALLDAITTLIGDPARAAAAGLASKQFSDRNFTAAAALARYHSWVEELL